MASAAFGSLGLNDCAGVRVYIKDVPVNRDYKSLICYIVGTPLQFSFGGSASTEPAAEKMLASLE